MKSSAPGCLWGFGIVVSMFLPMSLFGCHADNARNYLGVWQTGENTPTTVEIRRDGETYLFDDLRRTDYDGKRVAPRVLTVDGQRLVVSNGFGSTPLALSEDRKSLYFDKWKFVRLPPDKADEVKASIAGARKRREQDQQLCKQMESEFRSKSRAIDQASVPMAVKSEQRAALKADIKARIAQVSDCGVVAFLVN